MPLKVLPKEIEVLFDDLSDEKAKSNMYKFFCVALERV